MKTHDDHDGCPSRPRHWLWPPAVRRSRSAATPAQKAPRAARQRSSWGSQDYYSNEIIAEVYAQALEDAGDAVDRQMRIGQREVYMPEIEAGTIDVFPEYTGNLLQYLDQNATARSTDESTTR